MEAYGRNVGLERPGIVGDVDDDRRVSLVATEKDGPGVQSSVYESVGGGYSRHSKRDILLRGELERSFISGSQCRTIWPRISRISTRIESNDGVDRSVGHKQRFEGDILVGLSCIDQSNILQIGHLDGQICHRDGILRLLTGFVWAVHSANGFGTREISFWSSPISPRMSLMTSVKKESESVELSVKNPALNRVDDVPMM